MPTLLTLLAVLATQGAQTRLEQRTRWEELPNGVRVVVVEDHTLPLVSIQVGYAVGWRDEPAEAAGICRQLLLSVGADLASLKPEPRLDEPIETEAASDTSRIATVVPAQHFEPTLRWLAARLDLESTLTALRQLRDSSTGRHAAYTVAQFDPLLWRLVTPTPPAPASAPTSAPDSAAISFDAALAFARAHFSPANATLFVIGDVSAPRALELATALFGGMSSTPRPVRALRDLPPDEHIRLAPPTGPYLRAFELGWTIPPAAWAEFAATEVLFERLFNRPEGELSEALRAAGVWADWRFESFRDLSVARVAIWPLPPPPGWQPGSAGWGPSQADTFEQLVRSGLERIAAEPVDQVDHRRAVRWVERSVRERAARFGEYALHLAKREMVDGNLLLADFDLPRYRHVPAAEVRRAAVELLAGRSVSRLPGPHEPLSRFGPVRHSHHPDAPWERPRLKVTTPASSPDVLHWTAGAARVSLCPLPGAPLAAVFVDVDFGDSTVADRAASLGRIQAAIDEWAAVARYRGLVFAQDESAIAADGPPELVPQMIERSLELLRAGLPRSADSGAAPAARPACLALRIIVVGDMQADALGSTLATLLEDDPDFGTRAGDSPIPTPAVARNGPRLAVHVEVDGSAEKRLTFRLRLPPVDRPAAIALLLDAGALCADETDVRQCARDPAAMRELVPWPTSSQVLVRAATPWRYQIGPDGVTLHASIRFAAAPPADTRLAPLDRLQRLQSLADVAALEAALERARLNRICELDGPRAIADALARGLDAPWDLADELDAVEGQRLLGQLFAPGPLRVEAPGVDASWRALLSRYGLVR